MKRLFLCSLIVCESFVELPVSGVRIKCKLTAGHFAKGKAVRCESFPRVVGEYIYNFIVHSYQHHFFSIFFLE